jgi:hypothetical protein
VDTRSAAGKSFLDMLSIFEIIAGKSFSVGALADTRRFGFVQKYDCHPERRLMAHLTA